MHESQSLFHQVCVRSSLGCWGCGSTDGSQSLFHQVCVRSIPSFMEIEVVPVGRNPFFIRSVFVLFDLVGRGTGQHVAIPFSSGLCSFMAPTSGSGSSSKVAIPFSSGLCSFKRNDTGDFIRIRGSQSLFHQVCVRSALQAAASITHPRRNPFFIRSVFVQARGGRGV